MTGSFVLASILTGYPDTNFRSSIVELQKDESIELSENLKERLRGLADDEQSIDDLRSEYIAIFDQSKSLNPLYETEYGRERAMFKAKELSDIAGFYQAFGFELDPDANREMIDHISVELEFYSLLLMKYLYLQDTGDVEGRDITYDGMQKFMLSHLGRFVPAILEREGLQSSPFYIEVFQWLEKIVAVECDRLKVEPEKISWFSSQAGDEEIRCGGTEKC